MLFVKVVHANIIIFFVEEYLPTKELFVLERDILVVSCYRKR